MKDSDQELWDKIFSAAFVQILERYFEIESKNEGEVKPLRRPEIASPTEHGTSIANEAAAIAHAAIESLNKILLK